MHLIENAELISQRVRSGEPPSQVLRDLMSRSSDITKATLGSKVRDAFPECQSGLIHSVWQWREYECLPMWDEWFDLNMIETLLADGVDLPWTVEFCKAARARLGPLVDEADRLDRQKALDAMAFDNVAAKIDQLPGSVHCIEAQWDGGTNGWFIRLNVIMGIDGQFFEHFLGCISHGGDMRLFNGTVPPWPEAEHASALGTQLAEHYGAEFYFASPTIPNDSLPSWLVSNP